MAAGNRPLWRRVFDDVERKVGRPLTSVTSSTELHSAAVQIRRVGDAVSKPVQGIAGVGLHLIGLPSPAEVKKLRREVGEVQREILAMRRAQALNEREQRSEE